MKRTFWVLLLALGMLAGGCSAKSVEPLEAPTCIEETGNTEGETESTTETESLPETLSTEETPLAPEAELVVQNDSFNPGTVLLNPAELRPKDGVWALGGNKVYFGHYAGAPMVFRVLASPDTQTVKDDSLLLDCDTVLERKCYDDNFHKNDAQIRVPSEWTGSDIDVWLNGDFYGGTDIFSPLERAAIAETVLDEQEAIYTIGNWTYEDYGGKGYLFLLSAGEAKLLYAENAPRAKDGESTSWWVRSSFGNMGNGAGSIHGDGHICNNSITNFGVGVSPAMNIQVSSILFVSSASGEESTEVWKLTLKDPDKTVKILDGQAVTREETEDGAVITVPYTCTGEDINRISVLITDRDFSDTGAQVLYYGTVKSSPTGTTGKGAFLLPVDLAEKNCGEDYYAYILAENVGGEQETDYASMVCPVTIPAASLG